MKKILIVVDMQRDFIDGSLGTKEAQAIVPAAAERIRKAREEGWQLIATMDTHYNDYPDTAEGKKLPVVHCIAGTEGWLLHPAILEALGNEVLFVQKPTFGCIGLADAIRERMLDGEEEPEIEVIGLCTDICVVSNVLILKAAFPEAKLAVNAACCAGVTPAKHEAALETMRSCQVDIV